MTISRVNDGIYRIGSASERIGCDYCFKTLDPNRGDDLNRAFARCTACKRSYHQSHAQSRCPMCQSDQLISLRVTPPPPLRSVQRRPIALKPLHSLPRSEGGMVLQSGLSLAGYLPPIRHGLRLVLLGLLATLFIVIAAAIGSYSYRGTKIYSQNGGSSDLPELLVDAILRESVPRPIVFTMALLAAGVTAYALFPVTLRDKRGQRSLMRWIWRIIGGLVLLLTANVLLLDISFLNSPAIAILISDLLNRSSSREIIFGQIGAVAITTTLSILYLIITRNPPLTPGYPPLFRAFRLIGSLVRYLIVFYIVICLIVSIAVTQLSGTEGLIFNFVPVNTNRSTDAEVRVMIIALIALAVGLLLYHIPHYRMKLEPGRPLNITIRLLGAFACLGLAAYLYNQEATEFLIEAAALGGGLALVFLPVQRAYT